MATAGLRNVGVWSVLLGKLPGCTGEPFDGGLLSCAGGPGHPPPSYR